VFLWAGLAARSGADAGDGCLRWDLLSGAGSGAAWQPMGRGWRGGSCRALAFSGGAVLAASHAAGVLRLDADKREAEWQAPAVTCGLPLRDAGRLEPVEALASGRELLLAGGPGGVFRSEDRGARYVPASSRELLDAITLPETWLFVSGEHEIEVVEEHDAR
jgi:hypothetical protein